MMGFNSNSHGGINNPSSSIQNPNFFNLAEPRFTQEPSNPNAFKPPDHNWIHLNPPPSIPSSYPTPNSGISYFHPNSLPSTSSYSLPTPSSSIHPFRPNFPQYPPPSTPGNSYPITIKKPGFDILRSPHYDYTQRIHDLGYTASCSGFRKGMSDEEHGRRMGNDGSLLSQDYGIAAIQHHLNGVEPLDESNYTKWKSEIDIILGYLDYDIALLEPKPDEPKDTSPEFVKAKYRSWMKANRMCILIIQNSIPEIIRCGIPETDSAKDLMDVIKTQFAGPTKAFIGALISELCTMKFDVQGSVREHIIKMANLVNKLKDLNMVLPDDFLVHVAINSLPGAYKPVKVNFNTAVEKWSLDELIAQCLKEEALLRQKKVVYPTKTTLKPKKKDLKKSKKKKVPVGNQADGKGKGKSGNLHGQNIGGAKLEDDKVCFFCHKPGHIMMKCRRRISGSMTKQNGESTVS